MKNCIDINDNLKFSQISGDYNKIHINDRYAKKFFFKYCVAHGVNIVALCLSKFLKKNYKYFFLIDKLDIKFNNYIEINEKFEIKIYKNKIIVKNNINDKLEIKIKYKKFKKKPKFNESTKLKGKSYYFNNLLNKNLINELLILTKKVGTDVFGDGSLILKIFLQFQNNGEKKNTIHRINQNAFNYYISSEEYKVQCLIIKIQPYKKENFKIKLNNKFKKHLRNKSVLIFGSDGTLGSFTQEYLCKYKSNLHLVSKNKNEISSSKHYMLKKISFFNLNKILKKSNPDYIFYFISPKILKNNKKTINKKLYNLYKFYYVKTFKKILELLKKFKKKYIFFILLRLHLIKMITINL